MSEPLVDPEADSYLARYARRNYALYMLTIFVSFSASSFGDMSVFVPSLAMRLHAPSWLVTFPMVASLSITYAPTLLVAWLMGPRMSRSKAYAASVALMYVPILILAVFLFRGGSNHVLLPVFAVSIVLWSLAMGLSILPCWDWFARVFAEGRRAKVMGQGQALGQLARLLSAGAAAWLISDHSPLPHPKNYAAGMLIFAAGGLISAAVILFTKEYIPPAAAADSAEQEDRSLRAFVRGIRDILRTDRHFVSALKVVALSYTMAAAFPVVLSYAQQHRGFSAENDVAWMVATRPYLSMPFVLLCGFLAHRIGAARVSGLNAALMAAGIPLTFVAWGRWQLVPLFMVLLGETMTTYAMLAVMDRAPAKRMHHYLAIYFTACMIPGLAPLALAPLSDHAPVSTLVLIMLMTAMISVGFLRLDRKRRHTSSVVAIEPSEPSDPAATTSPAAVATAAS